MNPYQRSTGSTINSDNGSSSYNRNNNMNHNRQQQQQQQQLPPSAATALTQPLSSQFYHHQQQRTTHEQSLLSSYSLLNNDDDDEDDKDSDDDDTHSAENADHHHHLLTDATSRIYEPYYNDQSSTMNPINNNTVNVTASTTTASTTTNAYSTSRTNKTSKGTTLTSNALNDVLYKLEQVTNSIITNTGRNSNKDVIVDYSFDFIQSLHVQIISLLNELNDISYPEIHHHHPHQHQQHNQYNQMNHPDMENIGNNININNNDNKNENMWTIPTIVQLMKSIIPILHYLNLYCDNNINNHNNNTNTKTTTESTTILNITESIFQNIYKTILQFMQQEQSIWSSQLVYIAITTECSNNNLTTTTTTSDTSTTSTTTENNTISFLSTLNQSILYLSKMYPSIRTCGTISVTSTTNNMKHHHNNIDNNTEANQLLNTIIILYSTIWDIMESIHDHCCTLHTDCNYTNDNNNSNGKLVPWWFNSCNNNYCMNDNDSKSNNKIIPTIESIICNSILHNHMNNNNNNNNNNNSIPLQFQQQHQSYYTNNYTTDMNNDLDSIQQQYKISCFNLLKHIVQQQNIDSIPNKKMIDLFQTNDWIQNMIHDIQLYIEHQTQSSNPQQQQQNQSCPKYNDLYMLQCIELLLIVMKLSNQGKTTLITSSSTIDQIRNMILMNHTFIQHLLHTMILFVNNQTHASMTNSTGKTGAFIGNESSLLIQQQQTILSIIRVMHQIIPDTIDTILSSHYHHHTTSTSSSTNTSINWVESYIRQSIHFILTTNIDTSMNSNSNSSNSLYINHMIECIIFLHSVQRSSTRHAIMNFFIESKIPVTGMSDNDPSASASLLKQFTVYHLLQKLFALVQYNDSLPTINLLEHLLIDSIDIVRCDELSRQIWNNIQNGDSINKQSSSSTIENCLWTTISNLLMQQHGCSCSTHYTPILIKLFDVAYLLLRTKKTENNTNVRHPIPNIIELLLQLIVPNHSVIKKSGITTAIANHTSVLNISDDTTGNTPTIQNLSRCENNKNFNDIDDNDPTDQKMNRSGMEWSIVPPTSVPASEQASSSSMFLPWDYKVQLSAATLLTALVNESYSNNGILAKQPNMNDIFLREKILDAINSYIIQMNVTITSLHTTNDSSSVTNDYPSTIALTSPDMTRRRLRLLMALVEQPDNEEYISNALHITEQTHRTAIYDLHRLLDEYKIQIKNYQNREEQLILENESYIAQLSTQSVQYQYEKNEIHRQLKHRAKEMVIIHEKERQEMERQVQTLSYSVRETQEALQASRQSEQSLQSKLNDAIQQLNETQAREKKLLTNVEKFQAEARHNFNEMTKAQLLLSESTTKIQVMERNCHNQSDQIEQLEQSESDLQICLENLFGDMVQLAHMYVAKENEVEDVQKSYEAKLQESRRRLQIEQDRNDTVLKENQQKEYDHDLLLRKYQRLKDKLEQERKDHQQKLNEEKQRHKRNGPISYMNQLHQNASMANTESASENNQTRNVAKNVGHDKENGASYKSTSTNSHRDRTRR